MTALKAVIIVMLKNLAAMVITEKVILWGLKLAVKNTKNKIDDNIVGVVEGAYKNDVDKVMRSIENIAESINRDDTEL